MAGIYRGFAFSEEKQRWVNGDCEIVVTGGLSIRFGVTRDIASGRLFPYAAGLC